MNIFIWIMIILGGGVGILSCGTGNAGTSGMEDLPEGKISHWII